MWWENLFLPYANNKGADRPAHPRSLISAFVVHCLSSIIPLVSISEILSHYLASMAAQAGSCLTWSQIPKTGFLMMWYTCNRFKRTKKLWGKHGTQGQLHPSPRPPSRADGEVGGGRGCIATICAICIKHQQNCFHSMFSSMFIKLIHVHGNYSNWYDKFLFTIKQFYELPVKSHFYSYIQ